MLQTSAGICVCVERFTGRHKLVCCFFCKFFFNKTSIHISVFHPNHIVKKKKKVVCTQLYVPIKYVFVLVWSAVLVPYSHQYCSLFPFRLNVSIPTHVFVIATRCANSSRMLEQCSSIQTLTFILPQVDTSQEFNCQVCMCTQHIKLVHRNFI